MHKQEVVPVDAQPQKDLGGRRGGVLSGAAAATQNLVRNSGLGWLLPLRGFQQPKTSADPFPLPLLSPLKVGNQVWVSPWVWNCRFWLGMIEE